MAEGNGLSTMQALHRKRLEQMHDELLGLTGTAVQLSQATRQVLERGGTLDAQKQMAFFTGVVARLTKDWGVLEHLQGQGVSQKRPSSTT